MVPCKTFSAVWCYVFIHLFIYLHIYPTSAATFPGAAMALRLVRSSPNRAVRVRPVAGDQQCVVLLDKTLNYHSASPHPDV